jgi:hypothetical protein
MNTDLYFLQLPLDHLLDLDLSLSQWRQRHYLIGRIIMQGPSNWSIYGFFVAKDTILLCGQHLQYTFHNPSTISLLTNIMFFARFE